MKGACEGKLRVKECFDCLQSFENCKSPGEDGLTAEFYKTFWNSVGHLLVDSLNYSYDHGELSNTQKQAIIKLIEKKGKTRDTSAVGGQFHSSMLMPKSAQR